MGNIKCNSIYLTWTYYKTPKGIRLNCAYQIVFENPCRSEIKPICSEQSIKLDISVTAFKNLYDFLHLDKPGKVIKRNVMETRSYKSKECLRWAIIRWKSIIRKFNIGLFNYIRKTEENVLKRNWLFKTK